MPPGAMAACSWSCGVWVNREAAQDAFAAAELAPSRVATWFRERVPCPHCSTRMTLRGHDMALFQGCEEHGYWVDEETVDQTGLARPWVAPQVQRARDAAKAMRAEREARDAAEREARDAAERLRAADWEAMSAKMRAAADAAERERQRHERIRAERLRPFLMLVQATAFAPQQLADYLMQLEDKVTALQQQVAELQRRS
jgi:chemotaxis protein histidine kinase CheA